MLSVKEKSMLAEYVRENNLHRTNVMSKEVYPKEGIKGYHHDLFL